MKTLLALLVPQGNQWIDARRTRGRQVTGQQRDANPNRANHKVDRDASGPDSILDGRHDPSETRGQDFTDDDADEDNSQAVTQNVAKDVEPAGAERHSHADFLCPQRNAVGNHAVQPNPGQDEREEAKAGQKVREPAKWSVSLLYVSGERLHAIDANPLTHRQQSTLDGLYHRRRIGRRVHDDGGEAARLVAAERLIHVCRRRLSKSSDRRVADDTDHDGQRLRIAAQGDPLSDRRSRIQPEASSEGLAEYRRHGPTIDFAGRENAARDGPAPEYGVTVGFALLYPDVWKSRPEGAETERLGGAPRRSVSGTAERNS